MRNLLKHYVCPYWPTERQWLLGLLLVGALVRLVQYIACRSLWFDEAMLAGNIVERSFQGLTGHLAYDQVAPIGFLWLEKLAVLVGGPSEYSLRFWLVVLGWLSLWLFFKLAAAILDPKFRLLALAFLVFCGAHIYYSGEVKQYMFDFLAATLIWGTTFKLLAANEQPQKAIWLGILGSALVWFSQPAIFVLIGCTLALA